MCRKLGRYFVRTFHGQCVSMVVSTYCHCFSVTYPGLVQLRSVFLYSIFYLFATHSHVGCDLFKKVCRLYNIFGSGANLAIHAEFMAQASIFNDGCKIGLLRGAGTHFATWFYAMHWLLRLKRALKVTIHGATFESVAKNARVVLAVKDIEDEVFWKSIFVF